MAPCRLRTLGGIGALLTCPCHVVPLLLVLGGTAAGAWLGRHLPVVTVALGMLFLLSLWLLLREGRSADSDALACPTCASISAPNADKLP